jgi:hypothetical protein
MTAEEYRIALHRLDISIVGMADVAGISRRQAQRIAGGHCPVPPTIAKVLRLMLEHRLTVDEIRDA